MNPTPNSGRTIINIHDAVHGLPDTLDKESIYAILDEYDATYVHHIKPNRYNFMNSDGVVVATYLQSTIFITVIPNGTTEQMIDPITNSYCGPYMVRLTSPTYWEQAA